MTHKILSIRIPIEVADSLETEAAKESRTLNLQLTHILRDRYKIHAPPVPVRSAEKSRNGLKANRKTKAEIS
jgi:hypothetical protein